MTKKKLNALSYLKRSLLGAEVGLIRAHFGMTVKEFSVRFNISQRAVQRWEKNKEQPTGMIWSAEKDIRLAIQLEIGGPKALLLLYQKLSPPNQGRS